MIITTPIKINTKGGIEVIPLNSEKVNPNPPITDMPNKIPINTTTNPNKPINVTGKNPFLSILKKPLSLLHAHI